ncbi:single-stranded DNA-binding protein [Streptomyces sp. NPDC097610]|uniref:single-stranded DNA-binding protein n=1 Tax=Streptomyces sp. NPDC097610 TaxID=3157227 RepID=UPI00332D9E44
MSGETAAAVRGRVYGTVQLRYTERGTPAARFTVLQVPREYDHTRGQWRDGEPVLVICTVTGPLARHVAECLTDAVHVIVTGNLALRDNVLYLDSAQVGVDLAHHVAYIDDTLPAVLAGRAPVQAQRVPTAPVPQPAAAHPGGRARPTTTARPAPAAAPGSDWWRSAPRTTRDAVTAPSRTGR